MKPFRALDDRGRTARLGRLAREALRAYDMELGRMTPLGRADNASFRIDAADGQRYALRIHRVEGGAWHPARAADEVRSELVWLAALCRDAALSVPEPVPTRDGSLYTIASATGVPEPRVCVLFRWVHGRFVDDSLSPRHLKQVGELTARLHVHAIGFDRPDGFHRWRIADLSSDIAEAVVGEFRQQVGGAAATTVQAVIARARTARGELGEGPDAFTLIHGDLHQENYLFRSGAAGAIDFDDCGWGHLAWDLAVTLSELSDRPDFATLRRALLQGYEAVRPLPAGFERHERTLLALRELLITHWFLERRHDPAFADWQEEVQGGLDALDAFLAG
jgi:Ser/Thr protein kinase RdoA (MazF antagonist)